MCSLSGAEKNNMLTALRNILQVIACDHSYKQKPVSYISTNVNNIMNVTKWLNAIK